MRSLVRTRMMMMISLMMLLKMVIMLLTTQSRRRRKESKYSKSASQTPCRHWKLKWQAKPVNWKHRGGPLCTAITKEIAEAPRAQQKKESRVQALD